MGDRHPEAIMKFRIFPLAAALALSSGAMAADPAAITTVKLAQEALHHAGFYSGRIDGNPAGDTQRAIAQFQIANMIPASGSLDHATLSVLGVRAERESQPQLAEREATAAAGGSAPASGTK
jgi:peptidoglycan hydrolase-like protein with peptidoglycan-binding domain